MLSLQSYKKLKKILLLHAHPQQKILGKNFISKILHVLSTRRTELCSKGVFGKVFSLTSYNFITMAPIIIKLVSN